MPVVAELALVGYQPEVALVLKRDEMAYCPGLVGVLFLTTACLAALPPFAAHVSPSYSMVTVCSK